MDAKPKVYVEMRLFPSRALAANKPRMCQDHRGLSVSVMSDRHHQQRKSAIAFHLLTKALTAKLLQTNSIGVFPSDITVIWGEEKGREERREEGLRSWDKVSGQSIPMRLTARQSHIHLC